MIKLTLLSFISCTVFGWPTVYPTGITICKPGRCSNGYTLFSFEVGPPDALLIDMNGNIINRWNDVRAERAKLLKNGHLLVVQQGKNEYWENRKLVEYNWNGEVVWEYTPNGETHHDFQRMENGNTIFIYREEVPEQYKKKANQKERRKAIIHSDVIAEVTPDKRLVWEWHEYKHLDINNYNPMVDLSDWTHTNTVQALPENKWFDGGDSRFKPGNIMISMRSLDVILIIDKETKEIVWKYSGQYEGGLSGPHEPHMIKKGLPGSGNILVFDNGASPTTDVNHAGESYVLEIEPPTKKLVWRYDNGEKFYSKYRGTEQRLPGGNTLICEADGRRIFEVTRMGEIVWEYAIRYPDRVGRAYRYPYNYCSKIEILGRPDENPVIPSPEIKLTPSKIPLLDQGYGDD